MFEYCFAWDNYGNGWSIYDKEEDLTPLTRIYNSASWNNGNPEVFSGKYDYDNNWPLDKNLLTIKNIMDEDPNYESNYKNRKFAISPLGPYTKYFLNTWIPKAELEGGYGFIFGSKIKQKLYELQRFFQRVLDFDNKSIGFLSNDSESRWASFDDCIAFNNYINYQITNDVISWNNNYSYDPIKSDQFKPRLSQKIKTPKDKASATSYVHGIRDKIISNCRYIVISDMDHFDIVYYLMFKNEEILLF